jgi:DNA replication and repair protein RecF
MRQRYMVKMNDVLAKIVGMIKGEKFNVKLHYVPYLEPGGDFIKRARALFEKNLEQDVKRKATSYGVHREDFVVVYEEHAIASFGSQGENRLVALALKMAPYFMIEDQERRPIIVLDDVLSELDEHTQSRLLTFLEKLQQVFITTTHYPTRRHTQYTIQENTITRRL